MRTSAIAEYQGALRPTMTHRTNHLAELGLISRGEGGLDRRNVVCIITPGGSSCVEKLSDLTCKEILPGQPLSRTLPERIIKYVDAMGSIFAKAGDLVLLAMYAEDSQPVTVTRLVEALGLLQPTVSMSVSSLVLEGLVERGPSRASGLVLTPRGSERAAELAASIAQVVVKRRPRSQKSREQAEE
ncbi:MAG: MarR family transcriptional regulator [Olsenella sp.]|nr:MarR family transcriptional regulator [Olsenella sp.]MCI2187608.1 MarR family transcriptional regulator [Olsenella sp.]